MRRQRKAEPVTLSEEDGIRYLHFGTEWIQGGMRVAQPFALELEYQRLMMAVGLFLPEPTRIVQLGLGAAALTKFCWREVPSARVVAVELSVDVIDTARAWFCLLPLQSLTVVMPMRANSSASRASCRAVLQVDLYDSRPRGPVTTHSLPARAEMRSGNGVASFICSVPIRAEL